jgi:hypothetical protein
LVRLIAVPNLAKYRLIAETLAIKGSSGRLLYLIRQRTAIFSGGVPTVPFFFSYTLDGLKQIYLAQKEHSGGNQVNELCVIGLVSYFEAFCKDHFASIINIEPLLLRNLSGSGQDITIDPVKALELSDSLSCNIGFLVAEKYDFGTAQKINALYKSLLLITPFSKDEMQTYAKLLRDRNLLVHHGGTFTSSYVEQNRNVLPTGKKRPFFDSLVISKAYIDEQFKFIEQVTRKLAKSSHAALVKYLDENEIQIPEWKQKAVDSFLQES